MVKSALKCWLVLLHARNVAFVLCLQFKIVLQFLHIDSSAVREQSLGNLVVFAFYSFVLSLPHLQIQTALSTTRGCHCRRTAYAAIERTIIFEQGKCPLIIRYYGTLLALADFNQSVQQYLVLSVKDNLMLC